jgi:clan AA aspartic protease (TIGR02281 family)
MTADGGYTSRETIPVSEADYSFSTKATLNGVEFTCMVDTGASGVMITGAAAEILVMNVTNPSAVTARAATGNVHVYLLQFKEVRVGNIRLRNVDGATFPNSSEPAGSCLLGQSFLLRLKRFEYRDGYLALEQ